MAVCTEPEQVAEILEYVTREEAGEAAGAR
jgi:hypothetical protein